MNDHSLKPLDVRNHTAENQAWFCVRAQPKHEHIAAAHLRQNLGIEVFLPQIRFKRLTRKGAVWVTEALFLNYFFAQFDLATHVRQVRHARGVETVVHFGDCWPQVPQSAITELRASVGGDELHVIPETFQPGDSVVIANGALHGLRALVAKVIPGKQRVAVLLDFLGRQTQIELPNHQVLSTTVPYRV